MNALYIVYLDKFTKVFADFLMNELTDIEKKIVIYGKKEEFKFTTDDKNIVFLSDYREYSRSSIIYKWAVESDVVIFSGVFGTEKLFFKFPSSVKRKSYFHLWGGDFYDLREKVPFFSLRKNISKLIKKYSIKRAAGIINLISGDYWELNKIVKINSKHFVAPVCGRNLDEDLYTKLFNTSKSQNPISICLGNSATKTNNHIQALNYLKAYKDENIEIVCPLSYGDNKYAKDVIVYGKQVFGDRFIPLTEYMDKDRYYKFISKCKIAVFNNDRQQALGNINMFLSVGTKIYMRNNTSMWETYINERKYIIYDIEDILNTKFNQFTEFEKKDALFNFDKAKYYRSIEYKRKQWMDFFSQIV